MNMIFGIRIILKCKYQLNENSHNNKILKDNNKIKFEAITTDKIKQILDLKKQYENVDKHEGDKDKIIEILRDEILLINHMNQKVLVEKDRMIHELKSLLKDKNEKIEQLEKILKRETNLPFL